LNTRRERAGKRRISALWIWGRSADAPGPRAMDERRVALQGGDPLIEGLNRRWQQLSSGAPKSLDQCGGAAPHVIVEFAPLTGDAHETLTALDESWFRVAQPALGRGAFASLEIIANDDLFRVTPRAGWRFWRRRQGWLEILASPR
jgi:hypothetical protein